MFWFQSEAEQRCSTEEARRVTMKLGKTVVEGRRRSEERQMVPLRMRMEKIREGLCRST